MITFMPYPSYTRSANALDWQYEKNRLSNQVDEAIVIAETLVGLRGISVTHPAVKMWRGHVGSLTDYAWTCLYTWEIKKRFIDDLRRGKLLALQAVIADTLGAGAFDRPSWLGDEKIHSSHRSILLAKLPSWYVQFGWKEIPAEKNKKGRWPYVWPV